MSIEAPHIDRRDQKALAAKLREYMSHYANAEWSTPEKVGKDPLAGSMIQLFARLLEIINQRLNGIADKHFLAFLEMMGLNLLPPNAARTQLVFKTTPQATSVVNVPAETRITLEQGSENPIVFETEEDLAVLPYKSSGIFSHDPKSDFYADYSFLMDGKESSKRATLFSGDQSVVHQMYIGCGALLAGDDTIDLKLKMRLKDDISPGDLWNVTWYTYTDQSEEPVILEAVGYPDDAEATPENVIELTRDGIIELKNLKNVKLKEVKGYTRTHVSKGVWNEISVENRWIIVRLETPISYSFENYPEVVTFSLAPVIASVDNEINSSFYNNRNMDVSKDFYPFGEKPAFNDTFYFSSTKTFERKGVKVTIHTDLSEGVKAPDTKKITLIYEYWNGDKWKMLGKTDKTVDVSGTTVTVESGFDEDGSNLYFTDLTAALTRPGDIEFICPAMQKTRVNGTEDLWIRVRIYKGNYGVNASVDEHNNYVPASYAPPSISSFLMDYRLEADDVDLKPESVLLENEFFFDDATTTILNNFGFIENPDLMRSNTTCAVPFQPSLETVPSVYFAFDGDLASMPMNLFFSVPGGALNVFRQVDTENMPVLIWECWNGSDWEAITAVDYTELFTRREMVQLIVPGFSKARPHFGISGNWIRVRKDRGKYTLNPEVDVLYHNVVRASHRITVRNELLGTSNGEPGQKFRISRTPVLEGQKIVVIEQNVTEEDLNSIRLEEGEDAVEEILDETGYLISTRIRWHEVTRLDFSGPRSRHYTIDRASGEVQFGDGKKGMIPPLGENNVYCEYYRYGGGLRGNVAAGKLSSLRTAIPFIQSVTNPMPVEGGVDLESLDSLRVRGPASIRSRNRAVSVEDYETLVRESTGEISIVKCLPNMDSRFRSVPGFVTIVVIPKSLESKPYPSPELKQYVEDYLSTRAPTELVNASVPRINVTGPRYLRVSAQVKVKYLDAGAARIVEERIRLTLNKYFNALEGGDDVVGWRFGRDVYISEVYRVIEEVAGVDYVADIKLNASKQIFWLEPRYRFSPAAPYPLESYVEIRGVRSVPGFSDPVPVYMNMEIAEVIPEDILAEKFVITGFQEGETITLYHSYPDGDTQVDIFMNFIIESVDGDILRVVEQNTNEKFFPPGSLVKTGDGRVISTLLVDLIIKEDVNTIKVSIPQGNDPSETTPTGDMFHLQHSFSELNYRKGRIKSVNYVDIERIYLDPTYITYPGVHTISAI